MTAVATKGRRLQTTALPEINTAQVISFLTDPTSVDVSDTLVRLWAESTEEDADNGYAQQARILAAILDRHVNQYEVSNAMEACAAISYLEGGGDVQLRYGCANTENNRSGWLDIWSENLAIAARVLGGNR
jgi:hypothetical protein